MVRGRARFIHSHYFSELIGGKVGENVIGKTIGYKQKLVKAFNSFNEGLNVDLKKWVESDGK